VNLYRPIAFLVVALTFFVPALRSEQPQKALHASQEERVKQLEVRTDAVEKASMAAAMEKDYIERTQKLYESYYQKTFNLQMWTLAIVGLLLIAVFGLVVRFSLNLFEQRTKLAAADATAQMRNEHARILAKEVQRLWDSNAADNKKLKEALEARIGVLERNLEDRSDFGTQLVQGLAADAEERYDDSVEAFRQALAAYKSSKPRKLIESRIGATTAWRIFDAVRKKHGEDFAEKIKEELSNPLYNSLEEELGQAALLSPWLTPLINERCPVVPELSRPQTETRPAPSIREIRPAASDLAPDDESDSCRLLTT